MVLRKEKEESHCEWRGMGVWVRSRIGSVLVVGGERCVAVNEQVVEGRNKVGKCGLVYSEWWRQRWVGCWWLVVGGWGRGCGCWWLWALVVEGGRLMQGGVAI